MNKYQSLLNDVNNGLLPLSKQSNWSSIVSLGEGCGKSELLEEKVRTLFICSLTSEFNLNATEKFSTLLPEQSLHLDFKCQPLSGVYWQNRMKRVLILKEEKFRDSDKYTNHVVLKGNVWFINLGCNHNLTWICGTWKRRFALSVSRIAHK